jgi:hypothetical protein
VTPPPASPDSLRGLPEGAALRLREAGSLELQHLVTSYADRLGPEDARAVLRNPHCNEEVIRTLAAQQRLLSFYEVRRELARHARSPEALAFRFVPGLYWRDLLALGLDMRVRPTVRRAADQCLAGRVPGLAVGEKVAIARRGPARVVQGLLTDPSATVLRALLENPRLSEGLVLPLAHSERVSPPQLVVLAKDPRWGTRYAVRVALCRNPRTPVPTALDLLPSLLKVDLRAVARDTRLAGPVRRRASLLLGEG